MNRLKKFPALLLVITMVAGMLAFTPLVASADEENSFNDEEILEEEHEEESDLISTTEPDLISTEETELVLTEELATEILNETDNLDTKTQIAPLATITYEKESVANTTAMLHAGIHDTSFKTRKITATGDLVLTSPIILNGAQTVTLNLGGNILFISAKGAGITLTNGAVLNIEGPGTLIVSDGSTVQSGSVLNRNFDGSSPIYVDVSNGWHQIRDHRNFTNWYYFVDGILQTGWQRINNSWFFFEPRSGNNPQYPIGARIVGWAWQRPGQSNPDTYHQSAQDGFKRSGGALWYFGDGVNANGTRANGTAPSTGALRQNQWIIVGNKDYFQRESGGVLRNQWLQQNGRWFYFREDGSQVRGWALQRAGQSLPDRFAQDGTDVLALFRTAGSSAKLWYFGTGNRADGTLDGRKASTGALQQNQWLLINNRDYFQQQSGGIARNQWLLWNNRWFYFREDGSQVRGWALQRAGQSLPDRFAQDGTDVLALFRTAGSSAKLWYFGTGNRADGTLDGRKASTGALQQNQWLLINNRDYFQQQSGGIARNQWLLWNNRWFYFREDGSQVRGWALQRAGQSRPDRFAQDGTDVLSLFSSSGSSARLWYFGTGNRADGTFNGRKASTGALQQNQWLLINNRDYFQRESGGVTRNQWLYWGDRWFYFREDGSQVRGWALQRAGQSRPDVFGAPALSQFNTSGSSARLWYFGTGNRADGTFNGRKASTGALQQNQYIRIDNVRYFQQTSGGILR